MDTSPHISVVIPVYKAEAFLGELVGRLKTSVGSISEAYEIILVEDCGGDRSWDIIQEESSTDPRIKGIQFSRNFGQHYGITAGIDHASGDWIVVMDCDLQDSPEAIPSLYEKAREGFDIVLARRGRRSDPLLKRLSSWLFYKVFSYMIEMEYDGQVGNFRIISRKVADAFRGMREKLRFFSGLVNWMGFRTATIDIQHGERAHGKSTYTFKKLRNLALDTIIAYSDKPLRLAVKFGFLMSFLAFCYGGYTFARAYLENIPVLGWASLMVSLYFLSGLIIAILGMIGIYIGRTFDETKRRPLYIISKTAGLDGRSNRTKKGGNENGKIRLE